MFQWVTAAWMRGLAVAALLTSCATASGGQEPSTRILLAHDDSKADGLVAFPNAHFESLVRFALPAGEHGLRRIWLQPAGAGTYTISVYGSTPLEGPGAALASFKLTVDSDHISDGKNSRWTVQDVSDAAGLRACQGVVWVGFKKAEGDAALWSAARDAGQYFIRSDDPITPIDFLPVRRTPLVRLEIAP